MSTPRSEFLGGVRAEIPITFGVIPFGLIYGALAVQVAVPLPIAQSMSTIIFAGSAQFIAVPLIASAVPGLVLVLTVFAVNLRHLLYSASVAPYLQPLRPFWKILLAYLLTDEAYAVAIAHYRADEDATDKHWYFLGAGITLWLSWQASTAVGLLVGAQIPANWSLDFALPLTFIALVMPMIRNRAYVIAALAAGGVAVLTLALPYRLGLVLATVVGITAGMIAERREGR